MTDDPLAQRFAQLSWSILSSQLGIHSYTAKFWKAYLGQAYDIWKLVYLHGARRQGWSKVQTYEVDRLAAELGLESEDLTGRIVGPDEWQPGLLKQLYDEQILAIEFVEGPPHAPTVIKLQVFCTLPLLTPAQVTQLDETLQAEHRAWLEENLSRYRHGEFN